MDRRPRASSRVDATGSMSSDSSPAMTSGQVLDHNEDFNSYHHLPLAVPYSSRGSIGGVSPLTRGKTMIINSENTALTASLAPVSAQTFEFSQPSRSSWGSPFPGDGPTSAGHSSPGDSTYTFWSRQTDSPMTPGYSPHLSGPTSALNSVSDNRSSFTSFAPSRSHSDSTWAAPTRSMSFGMVEDLPHSFPNRFSQSHPSSMDYRRRASEMHPPSLQTSNNSSTASIPESHMTPLSVSSPPLQSWGVPTTWGSLAAPMVTKAPDYGTWYGETAPLAKVQEEDIGHYGSEPTILYAGDHQ